MHHAALGPVRYPLLLVGILLVHGLFPSDATAGDAGKEWKTWKDGVRNILKIEYRAGDDHAFDFRVHRNKDWNGQGDEFDHLESFTLTKDKPHHANHYPEFYKSVAGPIDVAYEVTADYAARKVHSKGTIKYPDPNFPFPMHEKKWDQDFFSMPTPDNIILTHKDGYDFDEVSEVWTAFCSDFACGSWVSFGGYTETHRYDVDIPGTGKVIVQLWKRRCPRFSDNFDTNRLKKWNFGGKYPGGIGAEVGVYRPRGKGSMMDAAGQDQWVPVVDPKLRISFQLIDPRSGKVLVEAEEKNTWWRTKWITMESFEKYKQGTATPDNLLEYELHYSINGVKQPVWKYSGEPGVYPLGFDGIWMRTQDSESVLGRAEDASGVPKCIEVHRDGKNVRMTWDTMPTLALTIDGAPSSGSDRLGEFKLAAKESGGGMTLDFTYPNPIHNRSNVLSVDEKQRLTVTGFGLAPLVYAPR